MNIKKEGYPLFYNFSGKFLPMYSNPSIDTPHD